MSKKYQKSVYSRKQGVVYWLLVSLWVVSLIHLFIWWFGEDVVISGNLIGYLINTAILLWVFVFPAWFFVNAGRAVKPMVNSYPEGRIALVVTKAPSEPWHIVQKTLEGMLAQEFPRPYDVWLADEKPDQQTIDWCQCSGVKISTRNGVVEYHRAEFPRRTRSKEGNLSYFYDMYGYQNYDFVLQFDADHEPEPEYLHHIMIAFADPKVGYVAAPSICDANVNESWLVRARLWSEAGLHGVMQAGFSKAGVPFCIGSHYAVRIAALKSLKHPINKKKGFLGLIWPKREFHIGGVGPELAEDYSTALAMVANGWTGAFAIDAIAHGDGADSFAASMQQEFQWSRSLIQLLVSWLRGYFALGNMNTYQKFHFMVGPIWYIVFSVTAFLGSLLPIYAIVADKPLVKVDYLEFVLHTTPAMLLTVLIVLYLKSLRLLRPSEFDLVSPETILFTFIRWPWALWGCVNGIIGSVLGVQLAFKVTKKGSKEVKAFSATLLLPYFVLAAGNAYVSLAFNPANSNGYLYFTLINAVTYSLVVLVSILWHIKDNWVLGKIQAARSVVLPFIGWLAISTLVVIAFVIKFPEAMKTILGA